MTVPTGPTAPTPPPAPSAPPTSPAPGSTQKFSPDIPWTLIDSSPDMMDTTFCDKKFPPPFRSSVAVYAYQPPLDQLPPEIACSQRLVYLKISCSITGYQPTGDEKSQIVKLLDNVPQIDPSRIDQIIGEYLACYGVLLNVGVFPFDPNRQQDLDKYPRVVDFEPKLRELLQATTEAGEVLSSSASKVNTDSSFTTTNATKETWKASSSVKVPVPITDGISADVTGSGELGGENTLTEALANALKLEDATTQSEKATRSTNLSQLYNLLTGYHSGSNRATFLMLPRPHILQPTSRRTFVQGVREIEGVQDFLLLVSLPKDDTRMKVDVHLQTGHFAENIELKRPGQEELFETMQADIQVTDSFSNSHTKTLFGDGFVTRRMNKSFVVVNVTDGWEADPTRGAPNSGGVEEIAVERVNEIKEFGEDGRILSTRPVTVPSESPIVEDVNFGIRGRDLIVTATLRLPRRNIIQVLSGRSRIARFDRIYRVHLRRPRLSKPVPVASAADLLITQRSLCAQIDLGDCLSKIPIPQPPSPFDRAIVDEVPVPDDLSGIRPPREFPGLDLAAQERDDLLRFIRGAMVTSQDSPRRRALGTTGYIDSRTFARRLLQSMPKEIQNSPLRLPSNLPAAAKLTIGQALLMPPATLARRIGVSLEEAQSLKGDILARLGEEAT